MNHIPLGTYRGVPLSIAPSCYLFWSLWTLSFSFASSTPIWVNFFGLIVVMLFIILHEYGHVFAAQKFNIPVKAVELHFFGGVAVCQMDNVDNGKAQFWIGIAGPIVTIILATLLVCVMTLATPGEILWAMALFGAELNVILFLFNVCIPALPMDGGRIFAGLLSIYTPMKYLTAMKAALWMACLTVPLAMVYFAMNGRWVAVVILPLVLLMAFIEYSSVKYKMKNKKFDEEFEKIQQKFADDIILLSMIQQQSKKLSMLQQQSRKVRQERSAMVPNDDPFGEQC